MSNNWVRIEIVSADSSDRGRLYFLQGELSAERATQLAHTLLADPVTERAIVRPASWEGESIGNGLRRVEVTLLPGVTDSAAENMLEAAQLLGYHEITQAATGQWYLLPTTTPATAIANPVIQQWRENHPITPPFIADHGPDNTVEQIEVRSADDDRLLAISKERRLALDLAEMQAVRTYYQSEQRDPTDLELEMIAQTWSEHCVHKTFRATIDYNGPEGRETVHGLLKSYIRAATDKIAKSWVHSAFVDNAGLIAFDEMFDLAFKVETHNHPSALEPFGGANTGVGGVVRDILGVSARPIANTDILCFGPQELSADALPVGVLHPQQIQAGVVHGVEDYGNKMGIPTVNGAILYHPGYTANPLVYCGCLGILPHGSHRTQSHQGDLLVAIGGRTGRDGLRGATFSSMDMDVETSTVAGSAVQIGHPIHEKQVQEVILRARDADLYTAITDCGAGGFSSAVGEMASQLGAGIQLLKMPLKYAGLRPWEMWLSEAQERMVLAVPPHNLAQLEAICVGQNVEATVLGQLTGDGEIRIFYGDRLVGRLSAEFLHHSIPTRHLSAEWQPITPRAQAPQAGLTAQSALEALLAHPNIAPKTGVIRRYDHEVQGGTAIKPLVGTQFKGPSDAAVIVPRDTQSADTVKAAALSNGICPQYGEIDPYAMAWSAIDEAIRNAVAVGADPDQLAILDNFCWGNPTLPDRLGSLVRCSQGCYDAAVHYGTPFISGKDSLYNEYLGADGQKHAIPGTLLISAVGIVPDVTKSVTMDIKAAGHLLLVLGHTANQLAGSHYGMIGGGVSAESQVPQPALQALDLYRAYHRATQADLIHSCHDCSEGGLAVTLAEMCQAGGVGADVELTLLHSDPTVALFSESNGRLVVEVSPDKLPALLALLGDLPHTMIGRTGGNALTITHGTEQQLTLTVNHATPQATPVATPKTIPHVQRKNGKKIIILHANGTNRDLDVAHACRLAGGEPEIVHLNQLFAGEKQFADYGMLVVPGGFSYGDDLGAGVLWSLDLRSRLNEQLQAFVATGKPVLGICNGFQTLVKAGVLGLVDGHGVRQTTLTYNERGHFECRWVSLYPNPSSPSLFTQGLEPIFCPVAHGEGRFLASSADVVAQLEQENLIALRYQSAEYPHNPNGSTLAIAGICNPQGNVLGLMPHPENHIWAWQHPLYHRGERGNSGLGLFINGIQAI